MPASRRRLRVGTAVLSVACVKSAAVEDFACARDGSFLEVIQYLEQAAGPGLGVSSSSWVFLQSIASRSGLCEIQSHVIVTLQHPVEIYLTGWTRVEEHELL